MPPILQTDGLTKRFGRVLALDHLSLAVETGEVVGFLGPNGAGKTTTIRLLLDLIRPTAGSARIGGYDCHHQSLEARRLVGYLPGEMPIYPEMTGRAYLAYLSSLAAQAPTGDWLDRLLRRFDVGPSQLGRPMRALSHGTKRKLGIVQALMIQPAIAILDEPTSGLDPLMIEAFAEAVHEIRRQGQTAVFLSSHVLSEVEKTCDRVALVRDGRLMAVRTIAELSASLPRHVTIRFADVNGTERFSAQMESAPLPGASHAQIASEDGPGPNTVVLHVAGSLGPLLERLGGAQVADLDVRSASLEDYVLGLYRGREGLEPEARSLKPAVVGPEPEAGRLKPHAVSLEPEAGSPKPFFRRAQLPALVGRSIARGRRVFSAVSLILAGFQMMLVVIASSFQETRSFDLLTALMPMGVQQSLGPGALMLASFGGMVTFGYFHPVVVLAVLQLGVYAATEPAGEVEWGLFDLELARPVRRRTIVTRSLLVAAGATAVAVSAMMAGTWLGLSTLAPAGSPWPVPGRVVSLGAHVLLLSWVFSAAGLLAAAIARRRGSAFGAVAGLTVVLYLLNFLADAWPRLARLRPWTPFHYFPGFGVANGTAPVARDLATLAGIAIALVALAYWRFDRRDV
jgi:ABC-2 type transport system ATP-binding protein